MKKSLNNVRQLYVSWRRTTKSSISTFTSLKITLNFGNFISETLLKICIMFASLWVKQIDASIFLKISSLK